MRDRFVCIFYGNDIQKRKGTGNVYQVDFIVDVNTPWGFEKVVTRQYRDRDIVCDHEQKVFRPCEIEFVDQITTESWREILEQLKQLNEEQAVSK